MTTSRPDADAVPRPTRRLASVREAKAKLSSLLREVQFGTDVLITDRGRPIARLTSVGDEPDSRLVAMLEARGVIGPAQPPAPGPWPTGVVPVGLARRYLEEDRAGG